ncbi:helix-turn-helix domain-containing protein [Silicimonas sp. MF1-12-2]|uniref:helix-turn-helix domain-containing protein n=1 Tax=Silicimonas sp. MF1-12-2 TaxID=3384793 RepID=UPI0039B41887
MSGRPETSNGQEKPKLKGFDDFDLLLGDIMRGERATMGKSLLDVQRELKIKATYISAIENTDPSAFDTPGFIAGYVRSYARYLGLDPEWAFKTFCEEGNFTVAHGMSADASVRRVSQPTKQARKSPGTKVPGASAKPAHLRDPFTEPSVSYLPKGEAAFSGFEPRAIGSIAVLLVLLAGIGYGGWSVLQEVQKVRLTPVDQTPEVLAELDPLAPATTPSSLETGGVETAEVIAPTTDRFDRLYRPEALDVPVLVARDGPISAIDPDTIGALAPSREESLVASRAPRPDNLPFSVPAGAIDGDLEVARLDTDNLLPPVQVVSDAAPSVSLLAVRPSWVRVRAADGTVVFEKILDAGETFEVPLTEEPATLRAGNASSLYFAVNGQTYGPAGAGPEVVKDVVLAPDALMGVYKVADVDRDTDLKRFVDVAQANSGQ